jgi:hypothetical protein
MPVVESEGDANDYASDVENTQDAQNVKGVLCREAHSRNTIVGLSLVALSLIFKGQQCSREDGKGDPRR